MPALFEMTVRPVTPELRIAAISTCGIPQRPNPPDITVMPSRNRPASATSASGETLSIAYSRSAWGADHTAPSIPAPCPHGAPHPAEPVSCCRVHDATHIETVLL